MNIHISQQELQSHGCVNCIWYIHHQCPHKIDKHTIYHPKNKKEIEGICPEYTRFILSFAEEDDSVNTMWEKFSLYIARLQSLNDYKEFLNLRDKINELKTSGDMDSKKEMQYDIQLNTLRLWWERLNDSVRKGYGMIADRESKEKSGSKVAGILSANTINFNLTNEKKEEIGYEKSKQETSKSDKDILTHA